MKLAGFLIFFSIIFSIHAIVNYYIYVRGAQWLADFPLYKNLFRILMLVLVLAYPAGRFLEKVWYGPPATTLHWIGAFWFAGMLYATLMIFAVDLIRIANLVIHFFPTDAVAYSRLKLITGSSIAGLTLLIVLGGFLNAWHPKIHEFNLTVNKKAGSLKQLKIVAASDIHLGTIIGPRKTAKLVKTINDLNPDIILFPGDVIDEDIQPVIKQNLGANLQQLTAPMGVYAATGNHEYIGGVERAVAYLEQNGVDVIRDSALLIKDAFYLVVREDKDKNRTNHTRLEIKQLTDNLDKSKPIIALDHQPFNLDVVQQAGVDLQLSGHTHHGQLWPFGYITERIFEVSRGYKQKGNSHFIVSTGFGTWGPPIRTGNRPEIIIVNLTFKDPETTN